MAEYWYNEADKKQVDEKWHHVWFCLNEENSIFAKYFQQ